MKYVMAMLLLAVAASASARSESDFDFDWRFSKGDFAAGMMPTFNDSAWRQVNLPHDWSIEGPFSAEFSSGTGYTPGGIAWYRKHFKLDASDKGKLVSIEFDGVYDRSEVWVNGQIVGGRPYGYSSFQCDLTRYVNFGGGDNIVAVRVDRSRIGDSRFYTGSGIDRNVRLVISDPLHVATWGTYVTTPEASADAGTASIETTVVNDGKAAQSFALELELLGPDGKSAASISTSATLQAGARQDFKQQVKIPKPQLWSVATPVLYSVKSRVLAAGKAIDEKQTPFGFRTIKFDADKGFFLNGQSLKLMGVCLHHDAGALGAAVPIKAVERHLQLLKEIGVNAIRCSHNPPAPEVLDLYDRMGFLVMDEAFDEYTPGKNKWVAGWNAGVPSRFGYAENFEKWSVTDAEDMVRRDRNHPSIVMWSVGNEIDYPNDPFTDPVLGTGYKPQNPPASDMVKWAKPLVEVAHRLDPTRPVTMALAGIVMSNAVGLPDLLDVAGYNYEEQFYAADHAKYPKRVIYGSENGHPYAAWLAVRDNEYISGQFLWTGIDYLGEAGKFPNRANGAGLADLAGFKKPMGWFRQSLWSAAPTVYLCANDAKAVAPRNGMAGVEKWNWPADSTINVSCFSNCEETRLTLNGEAIGTKKAAEAVDGILKWSVPFKEGTLKAEGLKDGKPVCEYTIKTAGAAAKIEMKSDSDRLSADGKDIAQIEFRVVDKDGVLVPDADQEVTFALEGPGKIIGIGNGDLANIEQVQEPKHKAYQGRGLATVQASREAGSIKLTAKADGLEAATVQIASAAAK